MKKILLIALAATIPTMAHAAISVEQTTSPDYLQNSGFSKQLAEKVTVNKARAMNEEYYTEDEQAFKDSNKFVKFWRKLYVYADPAAEDYSYYHHSTETVPRYTDY